MSSSSNNNKDTTNNDENNVLDVIIIGAGFAGLAAAKELQAKKAGVRIAILEGRNEMGGRCRTIVLNDGVSVAELGAQWIHGARKANPVYQAALASGIEMVRSLYSSQVVYQDANANDSANDSMTTTHQANTAAPAPAVVVPESKLEEMEDKLMHGKGGFLKYQERRQERDDSDISLRQCADEYLDKIKATPEQRKFLNFILDSDISQEYSGSLEDMSMMWWDSDGEMKGGDVHVPQNVQGGYRGILNHYAKDIKDWIQFNSKVTNIHWGGDNQVVVQYTQNGQTKHLVAKQVLVTVPIGVLQAKSIQFTPPLPRGKQRAIDHIGNGLYNKCVFLWDEKDANRLPWPQDKEWFERIASSDSKDPQGLWTEFFNFQPVTGRPMLCAFTAGRIAKDVEQHSDQEIQDSALQALRKMFADSHIPEPAQVVITKWGQDEFAMGSYSFNALGGKHSDRKQLAAPIDQTLYFAGEACHSQYFGTTNGALLSGVASAKQILQHSSTPSSFSDAFRNMTKKAANLAARKETPTRINKTTTAAKTTLVFAS